MNGTASPMTIDQSISYKVGRVEITLQRTEHSYTVTTYQGTLRIEDNCGAYSTEVEARSIARGYAQMYKAEHIAELTRDLRAAERRRDYRRVDEIHAMLDRLETPAQREADRVMLDNIAETIRTNRPTKALSPLGELRAAHQRGLNVARATRKAVA